jgi:hypothetical protein
MKTFFSATAMNRRKRANYLLCDGFVSKMRFGSGFCNSGPVIHAARPDSEGNQVIFCTE